MTQYTPISRPSLERLFTETSYHPDKSYSAALVHNLVTEILRERYDRAQQDSGHLLSGRLDIQYPEGMMIRYATPEEMFPDVHSKSLHPSHPAYRT